LAKRARSRPDAAKPPAPAPSTPPPAAAPSGPWAELLCGLVALGVYVRTLAPSVVGGDSGELITVGATLGVAHPPGYPLYTLLAKTFTLLPWGTVAERVNLFSALCAAAAAAVLCRATRRWTGDAWSGVCAAGVFAFAPLCWPYAVTAEVFPLNNLFVAALLLVVVERELASSPRTRRGCLLVFAFLCGLALTNHHTVVFIAAPFSAYLLVRARSELSPRLLLAMAGAGVLGLLPYLYLPWAAARHPSVAWGDPSSWSGFWTHLLRREYGTFRLASQEVGGSGSWAPSLADLVRRLAASTWGAAPVLLIAAAVRALKPGNAGGRLAALCLATLVFYVAVFAALANLRWDDLLHRTVQDRFWQQAVVLVAALMGTGLHEIVQRVSPFGRVLGPAWALGLSATMAAVHFPAADHRGRTFFRDYGRAILEPLPKGALLLVTSDEAVGSVRYLQEVEGLRKDVRTVAPGQVTRPWFRAQAAAQDVVLPAGETFTARAFFDANAPRGRIFVVNRVPWLATLEEAYSLWAAGLVEELTPKGSPPDLDDWVLRVEEAYARFDPRAGQRFPPGSWERYLADNWMKLDRRFSQELPRAALARGEDPRAARAVVRGLSGFVSRQATPDAAAHKNLGVAYQFLARREPSARLEMARHWRQALALNPSDPDREAMRTLIAEAERPRP
jgi:hypothetical protein